MNFKYFFVVASCSFLAVGISSIAQAKEISTTIQMVNKEGVGKEIGTITIEDTEYGTLLTPDLKDVSPGIHGFHLHENPSCDAGIKDGKVTPGLAAGGHYDPDNTGSHEGPYGEGHLGDLPPLVANEDGVATTPILAPRLNPEDFQERALIIHMDGDNFADEPEKLGGGGARLACGVIE